MAKIERSFQNFESKDYANEYYSEVDNENRELLKFFSETYKDVSPQSLLLEFGSGPTIYSLISAARNVKQIYVCDYLEKNLHLIKVWKRGELSSFWNQFIKYSLKLERLPSSNDDIRRREDLLKEKIVWIGTCDAFSYPPISNKKLEYDVVSSNFCAESITGSRKLWSRALKNIFSLVNPGGLAITTALIGANFYHVGNRLFPATNISIKDLTTAFENLNFERKSFNTKYIKASTDRGYKGIIMLSARKRYDS